MDELIGARQRVMYGKSHTMAGLFCSFYWKIACSSYGNFDNSFAIAKYIHDVDDSVWRYINGHAEGGRNGEI